MHAWHGVSMLKVLMGVEYTCSGLCKVLAGVYYQDPRQETASSGPSISSAFRWAEGSCQFFILQGLVYRSSLSAPETDSWLRTRLKKFHEWVVCNRLACTRMALACIAVEITASFVVLFAPWQLQLDWAVAAMGLHLGMWAPAGFDFVTYWAAALLVFGVRNPSGETMSEILSLFMNLEGPLMNSNASTAFNTVLFIIAVAYFLRAVWVAVWFGDLFDPVGASAMPFGSWPIFASCCDLFDGKPKQWCFTTMDPRQSGQVEAFLMINGVNFAIMDLMANTSASPDAKQCMEGATGQEKDSAKDTFPYKAIWFTTFSSVGAKERNASNRLSIKTTTGFNVSSDLKKALEEIADIIARETNAHELSTKRGSTPSGLLMGLINSGNESSDKAVKDLIRAFSRARTGFVKSAMPSSPCT